MNAALLFILLQFISITKISMQKNGVARPPLNTLRGSTIFKKFLTDYRWVRNSTLDDILYLEISLTQCATVCKCITGCSSFLFDTFKFECQLSLDDPKNAPPTDFLPQKATVIYRRFSDTPGENESATSLATFTTQVRKEDHTARVRTQLCLEIG